MESEDENEKAALPGMGSKRKKCECTWNAKHSNGFEYKTFEIISVIIAVGLNVHDCIVFLHFGVSRPRT